MLYHAGTYVRLVVNFTYTKAYRAITRMTVTKISSSCFFFLCPNNKQSIQPTNFNKMTISFTLLSKQNAETSNALIEEFKESTDFAALAKKEGDAILARDKEDAEKLQVGIDHAKEKGVIDPDYVPEPYVEIDVLGKSPDDVANEIIGHAEKHKAAGNDAGSVIVLCGLSGTGKVNETSINLVNNLTSYITAYCIP